MRCSWIEGCRPGASARVVVVAPVDERTAGACAARPRPVRLRAGLQRAGEEVGWAGPAERLARSLVDLDLYLLQR
jgi:hypothetical protein